jgi:hypothetical protein
MAAASLHRFKIWCEFSGAAQVACDIRHTPQPRASWTRRLTIAAWNLEIGLVIVPLTKTGLHPACALLTLAL